ARGLSPSRRRTHRSVPVPGRRVHRDHGDAVSWNQMIKAMNMPELPDDPRFITPRGRRDNNAVLQHIIEGWLAGFPSRDAAIAALEAERVPCAPVLTLHEAVTHPHLRQRGTVRRVRDESWRIRYPRAAGEIFPMGGP